MLAIWSLLPLPFFKSRLSIWKFSVHVLLSPSLENFFFNFILFNFTILYWFCHISKWICHRYTCVPHPEPSSLLPPFEHYFWALTIVQILFKFHKIFASIHYLFLYLFQDSALYLIALSSLSWMQQILVDSLFFFVLLQISSNFHCYSILDTPII